MRPEMLKVLPLVIGEARHMPELRRLYQEELLPQANLQLAEVLQAGMLLGVLRPLNPVITARALLGMFAIFALTQEVFEAKSVSAMPIDDIADTIVAILSKGIQVTQ